MSRPRDRVLEAAIAVIIAVIAYVPCRSYAYSSDDLQYLLVIREALTGTASFHPAGLRDYDPSTNGPVQGIVNRWPINARYPLEWPTVLTWMRSQPASADADDEIGRLVLGRALVGALGIGFFFWSLRRMGVSGPLSILATIGLATTAAYWTYSTHPDYTINAVFFVCVGLWVAAGRLHRPPSAGILGASVLLVCLATLYNILAFLPVAAILGTPLALQFRRRSVIGAAAGLAALMFIVVLVGSGAGAWSQISYKGIGSHNFSPAADAMRALLGFGKSQLLYPGVGESARVFWDRASTASKAGFLGVTILSLAVMALPFLVLLVRWRALGRERPLLVGAAAGFAGLALFNWYWDPSYIKFWAIPLVLWWFIAGVVSTRASRGVVLAVTALVIVSAVLNFTFTVRPAARRDGNRWRTIAQALAQSPPSALFITGGHPVDFYVIYFSRRNVVAPELISYERSGNAGAVYEAVERQIKSHRAAGGPVYIYMPRDSANPDTVRVWSELHRIPRQPKWDFGDLSVEELIATRSNGY
ncbi:MAG: hypothetical protein AB7N65_11770 [Vicinamibacterales bacterium]